MISNKIDKCEKHDIKMSTIKRITIDRWITRCQNERTILLADGTNREVGEGPGNFEGHLREGAQPRCRLRGTGTPLSLSHTHFLSLSLARSLPQRGSTCLATTLHPTREILNPRSSTPGTANTPEPRAPQIKNDYYAELCSGSEEGLYLRLIDLCITQLKAWQW